MFIKSAGIVLHCIKYSETSVIARIYTRAHGLLSFMVNGVRTAKSTAKAAMLQPGSLLELDFAYQENKNLLRVKEFKRAYVFHSIPFDVRKSAIALFMVEVMSKVLREKEANEEEFDFLFTQLEQLDKAPDANHFYHYQFLLYFAQYLGFFPTNNFSEQTPLFDLRLGYFVLETEKDFNVLSRDESRMIYELLRSEPFTKPEINFPRATRNAVLQRLLAYYSLHIETFKNVQSHIVLEAVFD